MFKVLFMCARKHEHDYCVIMYVVVLNFGLRCVDRRQPEVGRSLIAVVKRCFLLHLFISSEMSLTSANVFFPESDRGYGLGIESFEIQGVHFSFSSILSVIMSDILPIH